MRPSPYCPACNRAVPAFAPGPGGRPNARCPLCQALERHRFLALLLRRLAPVIASAAAVLDIAPHRIIRGVLTELAGERYVGLDRFEDRDVDVWGELTQLPFPAGAFDVVLCYHVLEHVRDDHTAMRELARVLSVGGVALIQVPRRRGRTDEDPDAPGAERVRRFGQDDHVRYYGEDFEERLFSNGLRAHLFHPDEMLDACEVTRYAVAPREPVWVCRRAAGQAPASFAMTGALEGALRLPATANGARGWGRLRVVALKRALRRSAVGQALVRARQRIRKR